MNYNPHILSRNERLAYVFKNDKSLIFWSTAQRRRRNPALQVHEQIMRYPSIKRELPVRASQYEKDVRITITAER